MFPCAPPLLVPPLALPPRHDVTKPRPGGGPAVAAVAGATAAVLLPTLGGLFALGVARAARLPERKARTLVIETMVKSPTLAYVLALRHFGARAAAVPAAAMVWLAALGAAAASAWQRVPVEDDTSEVG